MAELEQLNSRIEVETVGIDVISARLNFGLPLVQVFLLRLVLFTTYFYSFKYFNLIWKVGRLKIIKNLNI